jgi:hypothetical protein
MKFGIFFGGGVDGVGIIQWNIERERLMPSGMMFGHQTFALREENKIGRQNSLKKT